MWFCYYLCQIIITSKDHDSRPTCPQLFLPASPGKVAGTSELQVHHCLPPKEITWRILSVSVIPENKLTLQDSCQLIGIKRPIHVFWKRLLHSLKF